LKNVTFQPKDAIVNQPKILNLFDEYLQYGGFPEVIKVDAVDKRAVAKNIYNYSCYSVMEGSIGIS
jgi:predicted AAA+ superfamily ATPase